MYNFIVPILFTITFVVIWFAVISYRRARENLTFSIFVFWVGLWSLSLGIFYLTNSPAVYNFVGRIVYIIGSIIPTSFYIFTTIFTKRKLSKFWSFIIFIPIVVLSYAYLFTPLLIKNVFMTGTIKGFIYGPAELLFYMYFNLYFLAGFLTLYRGFIKESDKFKKVQYLFIAIGTLIGLTIAATTNIILPLFNRFEFLWVGPIGAGIWAVILTYGILRHHILNTRVIATEIFVGIIWFILFINTILYESIGRLIFNIFIFIVSIFFGYFLIKSVLREVEQREELERLNIKLKELDQAKSEFVSIASHQLRTPLTAIKGYISMILEKTYGEVPEGLNEAIKNVGLSNERLIKLVNDLLSISQIEAGKMEMKLEKLPVEDIITSVAEELKNIVKEKNLYLKFEKPKTLLPKILIDGEKIRQVILNFVDNAIKYTNHGGITVKIQNPKSKIQIIVSDTGEGLTKEEIAKMFESFSRGSAGLRFSTEGAGLGLYVAKKFVEMHKGKVWAKSEGKNKGSTFYIELPIL